MKQKLLIFFSIGLMIFAIDIVFNEDSSNKVTIYESELDSLINTWVTQVGREPTNEEIDGIIKQLIDEEILYREALKLGLDKNDIIIKRRLAQKISFLKQESISRNPSEDAIRDYYNINKVTKLNQLKSLPIFATTIFLSFIGKKYLFSSSCVINTWFLVILFIFFSKYSE